MNRILIFLGSLIVGCMIGLIIYWMFGFIPLVVASIGGWWGMSKYNKKN